MKNLNAFELTKTKKLFLLDMDGTVYHGDVPIPGAVDFIEDLRRRGIEYVFMTNNSSRSADAYLEKLGRLEFYAEKKNILTSGQAAARFLCEKKRNASVYVMGTRYLREEVASFGLDVRTEPAEDIDFLLVGYDTELTYKNGGRMLASLRRRTLLRNKSGRRMSRSERAVSARLRDDVLLSGTGNGKNAFLHRKTEGGNGFFRAVVFRRRKK